MLNITIDARNYKGYVNRPRARRKILEIMNKYELIDVWREVYPEKRGNTVQQGRLDYFLMSDELMLDLNGFKINPSYRSDNSPVFLKLKTEGKKSGKQYWKFNNSLLKDKIYISIIKQVFFLCKEAICCSTL